MRLRGFFVWRGVRGFCSGVLIWVGAGVVACSDGGWGRESCRKASEVAGSLCLEGERGATGEVFLAVYGTSEVTAVDLSELGGAAEVPRDGTPQPVSPGTGRVFWVSSDGVTHHLSLTLNAASGLPGPYAPLVRPPQAGPSGEARTFVLFLAGSEYAFVLPP